MGEKWLYELYSRPSCRHFPGGGGRGGHTLTATRRFNQTYKGRLFWQTLSNYDQKKEFDSFHVVTTIS